jgi:hypothetical protein
VGLDGRCARTTHQGASIPLKEAPRGLRRADAAQGRLREAGWDAYGAGVFVAAVIIPYAWSLILFRMKARTRCRQSALDGIAGGPRGIRGGDTFSIVCSGWRRAGLQHACAKLRRQWNEARDSNLRRRYLLSSLDRASLLSFLTRTVQWRSEQKASVQSPLPLFRQFTK